MLKKKFLQKNKKRRVKKLRNILFCFLILFLGGCHKKKQSPSFFSNNVPAERLYSEARCTDIPISLGVKKLVDMTAETPEAGLVIQYNAVLSTPELIDFYESEMELYGWRKKGQVSAMDETVLFFEKPVKTCAVHIRLESPSVKIFVTTPTY